MLVVASALLLLRSAAAPLAASHAAPPASRAAASPCRSNPLCSCLEDHFACNDVLFHRFPDTEAGVSHVSVAGARLGALPDAALRARPLRTLVIVASRLHHIDSRALHSMATTLASLDLGHNEFTEFPMEALRGLQVLNWLNLQNNLISELDPDIDWGPLAESLSSLSLSYNELATLQPGALSGLRALTRLELTGNQLRTLAPDSLPPRLGLLPLDDNLLGGVPCVVARLLRLRHLQLRNNQLRAAHDRFCTGHSDRIESVDFSNNGLDDSYIVELNNTRLKQIILDYNYFTAIPSFVLESRHLERLSVSQNSIKVVTDVAIHALKEKLERLDLDHNELSSLPQSLGEMSHLRYLSAAYNRLHEVIVLPPRLRSLSLAGNFLPSFPSSLHGMSPASLTFLDLSYNHISTISAEEFTTWSGALVTLNLKGNRIVDIASGVFPTGLPLRELMLSFNELRSVSRTAFLNLSQLIALELSSSFAGSDFTSVTLPPMISWLSLDNNDIHFISSEDIRAFSSLEYLNLDFNKLTEFSTEMIESKNSFIKFKLKELKLTYNYLMYVDSRLFKNFVHLHSLDLSNNRIHNVGELSFLGLLNLIFISLGDNSIEYIAPRSFVNLPRLELLDLSHNKLQEFSTHHFRNVSSYEYNFSVNVSHNRISKLTGGGSVSISVLDLSHNVLHMLSKAFFDSVGSNIRHLILSNNRLTHLDSFVLESMPRLSILSVHNNNITVVKKLAQTQWVSLQSLDLSGSVLSRLMGEEFRSFHRLFSLQLNNNQLRALPRLAFRNTPLELLALSGNRLMVFPASALAHVGFTLRSLDLARNQLEYLDVAMFRAISFLQELNLADNSFTVFSDNTFAGLPRLTFLDLSQNAVKTNFKELFHNLPSLRRLRMLGIGLKVTPSLPLNNLTELDISNNQIFSIRESEVRRLCNIRMLNISQNRLTALQPTMWKALTRITYLDVSYNPIVRMTSGSFDHLGRLLHLRMDSLPHLESIEPRAFRSLLSLRSMSLDTPSRGGGGTSLIDILAEVQTVESLEVHFRDQHLDSQLHGLRAVRLRALEIRGAALKQISADAFSSLSRQLWLRLRLTHTSVSSLPAGLLARLARVPHLALELIDNRMTSFESHTLYPNLTDWTQRATKLLPGGLVVSGSTLSCGCGVSWLGEWLRRWTAETGGWSAGARRLARRSLCSARAGSRPLLAVREKDACAASALSARSPPRATLRSSYPLSAVLLLSFTCRGP